MFFVEERRGLLLFIYVFIYFLDLCHLVVVVGDVVVVGCRW
jgi:hypothetical protein